MRLINRKTIIAFMILPGILIASGCGKNKDTGTNPPVSQPTHLVTIRNFAYSPSTINVAPGDTVTWRNEDSAPHTVTSDTGTELQSPSIGQGGTYQHIFASAGSFSYHCNIHSTMPHASVAVQ
jgi:plastocyanin